MQKSLTITLAQAEGREETLNRATATKRTDRPSSEYLTDFARFRE